MASPPADPTFKREPGRCAMRASCGRKSAFGGEIPCPDNGRALSHDSDPIFTATLEQVCGPEWAGDGVETCCDQGQVETLQASLAQAEPLLASCPACRLNFRRFYCHFTCSPSQSTFLTVTRTQTLTKDGQEREAVKEVEFAVSDEFASGFYESCRDVKYGATNGYAMDLLGGGAKDPFSFLRYMGQERSLGSPFQISFPEPAPSSLSSTSLSPTLALDPPTPFTAHISSCSSGLPSERCACPDCPAVCLALPPVLSPHERDRARCKVGKMDCFPFALVIVYAAALVAGVVVLAAREARTRWTRGGEGAIRLGEGEDDEGDEEGAVGLNLGTWRSLRHRLSFGGWSSLRGSEASTPAADGAAEEADPLSEAAEEAYDEDRVPLSSPSVARTVAAASSPAGGGRRSRSSSGRGLGLAGARAAPAELDGGSGRSSSQRESSGHHASLSSVGASLSHTADYQPRTYPLSSCLSRAFYRLGLVCAQKPYLTLALGLALCGLANLGWGRFEVERDPVRLWVPPGSEVAAQKERFEEAFGPFYRTEQIFLSVTPRSSSSGWVEPDAPVLSFPTLEFLHYTESSILSLRSASNLTLRDVCFAPTSPSPSGVPPPSAEYCVVQSPLGYFGGASAFPDSGASKDTWRDMLDGCADSPASCLPPFGQPINPRLVLSSPASASSDGRHSDAKAVIITYVLSSSLDPVLTQRAEEWEAALSSYLADLAAPDGPAAQRGLRVSYSTGLSLEQELNAATNTDVPVVVLSYLVMFAYVALALGGGGGSLVRVLWRISKRAAGAVAAASRKVGQRKGAIRLEGDGMGARFDVAAPPVRGLGLGAYLRRKMFVEGKFSLALFGIGIVLLSVSTSVALCSAAGVKVTLIIAEVIPFLVLAIGVDNVFLLLHTLSQQNARAFSPRHVTSSGLISVDEDEDDASSVSSLDEPASSPEERVARTLSLMGPSILLSASCETVAFALGALVGMPAVRNFAIYAAGAVLVNTGLQCTLFVAAMALDLQRVESNRIDCFPCLRLPSSGSLPAATSTARKGALARFVRTVYAPNLIFRKGVKYLVLALFGGLFVLSWIGARHVELGLDQRLALPSSSYLVDYFNAVDSYLDVGPPVYFVLEDLNLTSHAGVEKVCGRFPAPACDDLSVANVLEAERKRSESSYLAEPPAVWIDDFVQFLNPVLEDCCRVKRRNASEFCGPNDSEFACKPCFEDSEPAWSTNLKFLPEGDELMRYVRHWLDSPTDESCPLGGKASYSSALALSGSSENGSAGGNIELSHFRTYHTPLKTQSDFIEAYAAAQRISQDLEQRTGAKVFPYSLFYVFFQSYATIWATTREVLALALSAVFLVTSLLLGSFRTGFIVALTTFLSLFTVLGAMGAWGISLNPLSLVNLTVSVGIAVEFAAHLARAFNGANGGGLPFKHPGAQRDRDERAAAALEEVGASVVSGIGATKLIGVAVLFLTKSELLKIYYAKTWLVLIASSALHGLVFLPVALSFFGGHGYAVSTDDTDGGWIARRYEREQLFYNDEASDSDEEY
ncbi:niemann-Pick type C-related protein 1 [Rhodosporidiobolus nylandii]